MLLLLLIVIVSSVFLWMYTGTSGHVNCYLAILFYVYGNFILIFNTSVWFVFNFCNNNNKLCESGALSFSVCIEGGSIVSLMLLCAKWSSLDHIMTRVHSFSGVWHGVCLFRRTRSLPGSSVILFTSFCAMGTIVWVF